MRRKPLDDLRVRQALRYAIDANAIAKDLFGGLAEPIHSYLPPWMFGYTDKVTHYKYDPDKAKQLLKDANVDPNWAPSFVTQAILPISRRVAEAVSSYWTDIGVKVQNDSLEQGLIAQRTAKVDYDMWGTYISRVDPDQLTAALLALGRLGQPLRLHRRRRPDRQDPRARPIRPRGPSCTATSRRSWRTTCRRRSWSRPRSTCCSTSGSRARKVRAGSNGSTSSMSTSRPSKRIVPSSRHPVIAPVHPWTGSDREALRSVRAADKRTLAHATHRGPARPGRPHHGRRPDDPLPDRAPDPGRPGLHHARGLRAPRSWWPVIRERYGLDKPLPVQYLVYVTNIATGQLRRLLLPQPGRHDPGQQRLAVHRHAGRRRRSW